MLVRLMKFIRGYIKIRIMGGSAERFITLCSKYEILLWGLENKENKYELYIAVKDFKKLKPLLKKTNTRLQIMEKHGLPFFLFKYRKRKMFFGGIVIFAVIVYILSLFVWDIHISGNYTRTSDVILEFLNDNGVYHGMLKTDISCEQIEQMLRSEYNDITWASAQIKGTRLLIEVQENSDKDIDVENSVPSDILATKDCIITSIITRKGTPMVKEGQVVKKGDVLVSGRVEVYNDNGEIADYQYYSADADIYAKSILDYDKEFSREYIKNEYTGNQKVRYYFKILNKKINIFHQKVGYNEYDMITNETQLNLGRDFYLPVFWGKVQIVEYKSEKKLYSKEEAIDLGKKQLKEFCEKLIEKGVQIVENNVKIHIGKNSCKIDGNIIIIEKTGMRKDTEILTIPKEGTNTDELE